MKSNEFIVEKWSQKYKSSINCSHPKGFSQRAHCAGKKKHNESVDMEMVCEDCGMCETHGNIMEIKKGQKDSNGYTKCWPGKHAEGTKKSAVTGKQVRNCVPNESISEENKGLYYNVNKRKKAGTSRDADSPLAPTAQAWKDAAKTAKKESVAEGLAQDESEQSHGWVADSIDEINYNTFEVHLTNTRSGESADLVIRPVDMMRISGKLQIETIDVRDLATGDTQSWTTEMPDPQGAIVDAIDALFWDNPQLNKKLYAIIDAHSKKGQDMLPGQKNRAKVGMAAPADQFIAGQDAIAKAKGTVKEFDAQGFQQRYTLYKDGYEIEKFGDMDDAIEYAEDNRRDGDDPSAVYKIVDINKQVVWDSDPYEKPSRIQLRKPEQGVAEGLTESVYSLEQAHAIFDDFEQAMADRGLTEDIFDFFTDEEIILESAAWRRSAGKSKKGGLNAKGVASYRRENPGSKLQMAVTTKPSKLKPGSKAAKRRKSFCARMGGVKGPMKKPNGKPTRKALALRKWNC
jgi:hypothetical protein